MNNFYNPHIVIASLTDCPALVQLLNSAYRGESSKQGWTTEANLIAGNIRTDETSLCEIIQLEGSVILKYTNERNQLQGCVNLQKHENKLYLGMLSVSPLQQGRGIGRQLLIASEKYARQAKCTSIYMTVISLRNELIAWYERHGYTDTGERKPFHDDGKTGRHLNELEFMVLEKNI